MSASLTSGTYTDSTLSSTLRQIAVRLFGPPARSASSTTAERNRAREAEEVRELAMSVERHSPGFAADLYAAALRHENIDV